MIPRFQTVPVVALLAVCLAAAPAQAAVDVPSSTVVEMAALINGQVVEDDAVAQRLIDGYWTPERMRAAEPVAEPEIVDNPELERLDHPDNVGPEEVASVPVGPLTAARSAGTQSVALSPGAGKVFFRDPVTLKNFVCSGSTINSSAKNVVSTAAHCIHSGKNGHQYDNWMYAPGYHDGVAHLGKFSAKYYHATKGWTSHSYNWWDFAFVNVRKLDGVNLVHKTGGNGILVNSSKQNAVTVLAYPGTNPYDGTDQIYCQANMHWAAAAQVKVYCGLPGGASGGPMIHQYSNAVKFGNVNGVVAYVWNTKNYSPYFDSYVLNVFNTAKDKTT
ncbi:trypsin-like serine peptidase [Actinokineospora sp. G85]|uniref:trypsin-like serine peptidase n=1 Tax=Actinokineospora sp. G85 TaxID=3406626 RepID=UPI003C746B2E